MARVLVVEPDRRIRSFIAGILADFGHQVERCSDGAQAGQRLRRARFDVVATDLVLDRGILAPRQRVLTLSGERLRPGAVGAAQPPRLGDKPFRFADLQSLVAAIGALKQKYSLVA